MDFADKISIRGLEFEACHGVFAEEKIHPQIFVVDLDLYLDLQLAGETDDLNFTVNYAEICKAVEEIVNGTSLSLIESICHKITDKLLNMSERISKVKTTVHKPGAPMGYKFSDVSVSFERSRGARHGV